MASSKASPSVSSFALSLPPAVEEEEEENMEHCLLDEVAPMLFFVTSARIKCRDRKKPNELSLSFWEETCAKNTREEKTNE